MTICAVVTAVLDGSLVVRECRSGQQVIVHTKTTVCFRSGDRVRIQFSGASTRSIPPQITAQSICRLC